MINLNENKTKNTQYLQLLFNKNSIKYIGGIGLIMITYLLKDQIAKDQTNQEIDNLENEILPAVKENIELKELARAILRGNKNRISKPKFTTQESKLTEGNFPREEYITKEELEEVNHPAMSIFGNNFIKAPIKIFNVQLNSSEELDNYIFENTELLPMPKHPNGANILFISDLNRCEISTDGHTSTIPHEMIKEYTKKINDNIGEQFNLKTYYDKNDEDINSRPLFTINLCQHYTHNGYCDEYSAYATNIGLIKEENNHLSFMNVTYKGVNFTNEIKTLPEIFNNIHFCVTNKTLQDVFSKNYTQEVDLQFAMNGWLFHEVGHQFGLGHVFSENSYNPAYCSSRFLSTMSYSCTEATSSKIIDYVRQGNTLKFGPLDMMSLELLFGRNQKAEETITFSMGQKTANQAYVTNINFYGDVVEGIDCVRLYVDSNLVANNQSIDPRMILSENRLYQNYHEELFSDKITYLEYIYDSSPDPENREKEYERIYKCEGIKFRTATPTITAIPTITASVTDTSSNTASATKSVNPTDTVSPTASATSTTTPTGSDSKTATNTISRTTTPMPTSTQTVTTTLTDDTYTKNCV